jgi:hypothetical protein
LIVASAIGMKTVWFDDQRNDVAGLAQRLATDFGVWKIRSDPIF